MRKKMASFYFTGPILIKCNIYTVIFKFSLIKSRVKVWIKGYYIGLELGFLRMYFMGFIIIIIKSTHIGMDWSRKLQSSHR